CSAATESSTSSEPSEATAAETTAAEATTETTAPEPTATPPAHREGDDDGREATPAPAPTASAGRASPTPSAGDEGHQDNSHEHEPEEQPSERNPRTGGLLGGLGHGHLAGQLEVEAGRVLTREGGNGQEQALSVFTPLEVRLDEAPPDASGFGRGDEGHRAETGLDLPCPVFQGDQHDH